MDSLTKEARNNMLVKLLSNVMWMLKWVSNTQTSRTPMEFDEIQIPKFGEFCSTPRGYHSNSITQLSVMIPRFLYTLNPFYQDQFYSHTML